MAARMRFPAQALEELRKADPETQVSLKLTPPDTYRRCAVRSSR